MQPDGCQDTCRAMFSTVVGVRLSSFRDSYLDLRCRVCTPSRFVKLRCARSFVPRSRCARSCVTGVGGHRYGTQREAYDRRSNIEMLHSRPLRAISCHYYTSTSRQTTLAPHFPVVHYSLPPAFAINLFAEASSAELNGAAPYLSHSKVSNLI